LNATWMRSLNVAAGAFWLSVCLVPSTHAAQPTGDDPSATSAAQAPTERSLSQSDVDKLLNQARAAIASGNLDQAEALVSRAEKTHTRYPLFHFGPTPSSVRNELTQAQQQRGRHGDAANANANNSPNSSPAATNSRDNRGATAGDPFAQHPLRLPTPSASQPMQAGMTSDEQQPVSNAIYNQNIGSRDRNVQPASVTGPGIDSGYDTPEAPLPPGLRSETQAADSPLPAVQSIKNQFAIEERATQSRSELSTKKARTLDLLRQARQALAAGNREQAQAAAQQAGALGVPESMFLPDEDKPSVLAWDIQQASAKQPPTATRYGDSSVAVVAASTVDSNDRYVKQTRVAPERDATRNVRATTAQPGTSNMRFAELPEPLELPADDAQPFEEKLPTPDANSLMPGSDKPSARSSPRASSPIAAPVPFNSPSSAAPKAADEASAAAQLLEAGEAALRERDKQLAATLFGQAYLQRDQLDAAQQQRLQEHLQMLSAGDSASPSSPSKTKAPSTLLDSAAESQQVLARQMSAEIGKKQSEARHMREQDPRQALKLLKDARQQVTDSKLSDEYRTQLLHRIDITLDETEKYINDHRSEIELDEKNKAVLEEVARDKEVRLKVQQQIADLVDQFNKLRDEQRFAEMEVVARRLIELAPDNAVAQQVWQTSKFIRREYMNRDLQDRKEESVWATLNDVENSAIQTVGDNREMIYDQKHWNDLVKDRKGAGDRNEHRTERELEIERRLKTPVLLKYENTPLSEVMHGMSELAGVNIHLDPRGLSQEGVNSDTPVTINLSKEISLKSALNLILEPLHLSYVVKDEVLKITSEQLRDGEVYSKVYNVADLVIPIPNFVPNNNIGLQGLINDAHAAMGYGQGGIGMPGPTVLVNNDRGPKGQPIAGDNNSLLAQHLGASSTTSPGAPTSSTPIGSGPGGLGAGANADFDSLIDLITSTVASESWAENGGGQAEIRPFPTNLSLVISQTQAVHEQIADLLEQLRRLQDLQVTIEVRFIRLNDSFFERIGVDFQANIQSNTTNLNLTPGVQPPVNGLNGQKAQSSIVGIQTPVSPTNPFPNFTSDLDIPFTQHSFDLTSPAFGNPVQVSEFGFAILSDIEAYFLIEAAQGDSRTNVLNAPKVTLFNGQQAFVADATSQPFVIGVIPVVGEFAAAQQPVIVVLNEGTMMSIQAVVSDDRRYVRLTVVPFFTQIGDVKEFTFEGGASSTSSSSTTDNNGADKNASQNNTSSQAGGVTVQLPSFSFVAVVTTVSVPDGGTVLLGGIKRLSEGRKEIGVPLLSKVPYINRLFKNVGIGRETDSLMMMVTPRIIIQEEEEERLGVAQTGH
jgi:general secretion pathway protein D